MGCLAKWRMTREILLKTATKSSSARQAANSHASLYGAMQSICLANHVKTTTRKNNIASDTVVSRARVDSLPIQRLCARQGVHGRIAMTSHWHSPTYMLLLLDSPPHENYGNCSAAVSEVARCWSGAVSVCEGTRPCKLCKTLLPYLDA